MNEKETKHTKGKMTTSVVWPISHLHCDPLPASKPSVHICVCCSVCRSSCMD